MPPTPDIVDTFVSLQMRLIRRLAHDHSVSLGRLLEHLIESGRETGQLDLDDEQWTWRRHGEGVSFRRVDPRTVVDVHTRLGDPTLVDAWRLLSFLGRADLNELELANGLADLASEGHIVRISYSVEPERGSLYRPAKQHPRAKSDWCVMGATRGGWIEFQLGPFENKHWKSDSLYLDCFDSALVYAPLAEALGSFDPFTFYEDLSREQAASVAHALHEYARAARSEPPDAWVEEHVGCPATKELERDEKLVLVADLADGIADWISRALASHEVISILGA